MIKSILIIILILVLGVIGYYYYPEPSLPVSCSVDSIAVFKHKRELHVFSSGRLLKTYKISLGGNPIGHKRIEGDKKTPEGLYFIIAKNPNSGYHKNLGISYPNEEDKLNAQKAGQSPGGDVKIHGLKNGSGHISKFQRFRDWTNGCIALTDKEMDELYEHVKIGTPIAIFP
jgi:murein L,D-transpeptidase YafK